MKYFILLAIALLAAASCPRAASTQPLPEETVFVDRAVLAFDAKRLDEALRELSEALRLNPASHQALYYQGLVYQELGRPAEAREALERAQGLRPQSTDIAFQLGVAYLKQEALDKAEPQFRKVHGAEPNRPNLGYYLGLIEYRKKNFAAANGFFRANVPSDEGFAQLARYYAGLAASALGFPRAARDDFGEALRIQPNSPLAARIPAFHESLEKSSKDEKPFHGEIRLGFFYDTNAAMTLDPSLEIRPRTQGPPAIDSQRREKSFGELASVELSYFWLRTLDWEGAVGYRFLHLEYNQAAAFSTQIHSPVISLNRRGLIATPAGELPYYAGLRWIYDYIRQGNDGFAQRWTINPYFTLIENARNTTNLQFRAQVKNFSNDPKLIKAESRDALNYMGGPTHFFLFDKGRHYIKLGYQYDRESAEGRNWDYSGNRLLAGFQVTMPWQDVQFRYEFDRHWRAYRHPHTLLPQTRPRTKKRGDDETIHSVSLSKDIRIGAQRFNFSIEYFFDDAHSNLAPFSFTRHVAMPSAAWRF